MRWNPWVRVGFAILAPVVVGVMLAAGEWAQPPASAQSDGRVAASETATSKAGATPEHVREVQQALMNAGYDPGPIDGVFGPRTKAAVRRYIAVPPPQVPNPAGNVITRIRTNEPLPGP